MQPVAATVVARNYLPFARTLCASFLRHHPNGRFFVLLVDAFDGEFDPALEQFELVMLDAVPFPFGDLFFYQYSILELSTAVKPFLFRYLMDEHGLETILYLDPDLYITAPLSSVYSALLSSSIVLTPHMFSPPPVDHKAPTERDIMLSGVYNLGFLGLRNDSTTAAMLDWWGERLATKCVVDPPNALFVDQRWMDLVPAYFDNVAILKDATLNVAYWNLHERKLHEQGGSFFVNDKSLTFFHFSGFNPKKLETMSKHQSRHAPSDYSALTAICRNYADALLSHGYDKFSKIPVVFSAFSNGVRHGRLTQLVIRRCIDKGIPVASPRTEPDSFSRFVMTPNYRFDRRGIAPLLVALEHCRPDVKAAFPQAFESIEHVSEIRSWVSSSGGHEEGITELFAQFGHLLDRRSVVENALVCWRRRKDLQAAFPDAFTTSEGAQRFADWIEKYGVVEDVFASGDGERFVQLRPGLLRVLMLYLQDVNLQKEFKFLFIEKDRKNYVQWLFYEACPRDIVTPDDVAWFDGFVEANTELVAQITLAHSAWLRSQLVGGATAFDTQHLRDLLSEYGFNPSGHFLFELYFCPLGKDILAQAEQYYYYTPEVRDRFPDVFTAGKNLESFSDFLVGKLTHELNLKSGRSAFKSTFADKKSKVLVSNWFKNILSSEPIQTPAPEVDHTHISLESLRIKLVERLNTLKIPRTGVNLVGYFHATTGMGESVRSMSRTLSAGDIEHKDIPLASTHLGPWLDIGDVANGKLLTSYDPANKVNVVVANGDDFPHVRGRLPYAFWQGRRNIGYWVWETEALPVSHADTKGLDEIWTPSEYSAAAIRKAVQLPVRVVPHIIDFEEIDSAVADRERFKISTAKVAYGYFFDCKSVMERKNPLALLAAYRKAFGTDNPNVVLVLKVSSAEQAPQEFYRLKTAAEGLNIVWVTELLSRAEVLSLMKSLDVYVSLHRSEGFGLTLAEAMAMAKPVVASNYSGNLDFMSDADSCLVHTKIITTNRPYGAYPAGTRWGEPDVEHASDCLKRLTDVSLRHKIGEMASQSIRSKLHARTVGNSVAEFLKSSGTGKGEN